MAIAFVQAATQAQGIASSSTAPAITLAGVTGGNCLILVASIYDANGTWTITNTTDDKSNSYVTRAAVQTASTDRTRAVIAYAVNVTGGTVVASVNLAGTSGAGNRYFELGLMEFSGVATSSPEVTFDANDDIGSGSDASAGPISTTGAGDLIIGCAASLGSSTNRTWGSPASHTNRYRQNDESVTIGFDASTWLPGSTQTTYTLQWTMINTSLNESCGVAVALKEFSASAGGTGGLVAGRLTRGILRGSLTG